jgi:hypothetical protein
VPQIADHLTRPGETLPFVSGSCRVGAFRCSTAFWVTDNTLEPISTLEHLRIRVDAWDGSLPKPEKITAAAQHAQGQAERQVQKLAARAGKIEEANLGSQRNAAALRLTRELGRLLRCLDPTAADLNQLLETQAARTGPLAERIRKAKELLGEQLVWTEHLRWELQEFMSSLTPNERLSRLSGSSIDAAFADYRWIEMVA